jgi:hypothetical protein
LSLNVANNNLTIFSDPARSLTDLRDTGIETCSFMDIALTPERSSQAFHNINSNVSLSWPSIGHSFFVSVFCASIWFFIVMHGSGSFSDCQTGFKCNIKPRRQYIAHDQEDTICISGIWYSVVIIYITSETDLHSSILWYNAGVLSRCVAKASISAIHRTPLRHSIRLLAFSTGHSPSRSSTAPQRMLIDVAILELEGSKDISSKTRTLTRVSVNHKHCHTTRTLIPQVNDTQRYVESYVCHLLREGKVAADNWITMMGTFYIFMAQLCKYFKTFGITTRKFPIM